MENVYIVTDSTASIPKELKESYNIEVLPLTIEFEGNVYKDGVDIDQETLLEMLARGEELPKTSQINPKVFHDTFKKLVDNGNKVIAILISSELSGTYQSACIARNMLDKSEDVYVVDSRGVSFGTGALVQETVKLLKEEDNIEDIVEKIVDLSKKIRVAFSVDTLEYIRKGGRISSIHAAVGTLLNIKPILYMVDGKIDVYDKVRGKKKAIKKLLEYVKSENASVENTFAIGNVAAEEDMNVFQDMLNEELNIKKPQIADVGSVIATYSGPGTVGVFFFTK